MTSSTGAQMALGAVVMAVLVAAFIAVGGPGAGKLEKRDDTRLQDLRKLSLLVRCQAESAGGQLPVSLENGTACDTGQRRADPYTETPYRYEKVSDRSFRLCAGFERPDLLPRYASDTLDPQSGCIVYTYRP